MNIELSEQQAAFLVALLIEQKNMYQNRYDLSQATLKLLSEGLQKKGLSDAKTQTDHQSG